MFNRKLTISACGFLSILLASCSRNGPEVPMKVSGATLEGTVYYGDTPVANAMIILSVQGPGAASSSAMADDEGHYKVDNAPIGQVSIGVNTDASKGMMMGKSMAGTNPTEKSSKKSSTPKLTEVPKKFHDPATSGLKFDVQNGPNNYDIKIAK